MSPAEATGVKERPVTSTTLLGVTLHIRSIPGSQARDVIKVAVLPSAASPEAVIEMVVRAKGMSGSLAFPGRRLTSSWWKACTNWTCTTSTSVSRKRSRFTAARHDEPSVPVTCAGTGCCGQDSAMLVCHRPGG